MIERTHSLGAVQAELLQQHLDAFKEATRAFQVALSLTGAEGEFVSLDETTLTMRLPEPEA